jgi:hypothetical protein
MLKVSRENAVLAALSMFLLFGCSGEKIKTHSVVGKVEIKDGDVAILTGSAVELKHESDEFLRPSGNIDSSGKFTVKTLYQGKISVGAPPGKYKARIILGDESDEGVPKRKGDVIHKRYLDFEKSKLSFTVPSGNYTVTVSKK